MGGAFRFLNELTTYVELQPVQKHSSQGAAARHRVFIIKEIRRNARRTSSPRSAECCFPASRVPDSTACTQAVAAGARCPDREGVGAAAPRSAPIARSTASPIAGPAALRLPRLLRMTQARIAHGHLQAAHCTAGDRQSDRRGAVLHPLHAEPEPGAAPAHGPRLGVHRLRGDRRQRGGGAAHHRVLRHLARLVPGRRRHAAADLVAADAQREAGRGAHRRPSAKATPSSTPATASPSCR